jgi:endonuclease/exonuclease/phosphatase (EEP) superfamily protein YafD
LARLGARRYWLIWAAVIPILPWVVVRLFGLERGFPLVPLVAYTPFVAVAALLVSGVAVALRNWAAALVAAAATVCLLAAVLPRAIGGGEEIPPGAEELDVLAANIHHGTADPEALMALVHRLHPQVLSIEELTPGFARELRQAGIEGTMPYRAISVHRGSSGGGLYSSLPLRRLPAPPPVAFRMPRALVELPRGRRVRVVEVHPYPPKHCCMDLWSEGLASLPRADPHGPPWVLQGDFNATLDHAKLRDLLDSGYRDAAEVTGDGLAATWPADSISPPPVTIDHVLADERIAIAGYSVEDLPGSDHRAVFARLAVR